MNQFHRLGRWSFSLFALLGGIAPLANAQERREIPRENDRREKEPGESIPAPSNSPVEVKPVQQDHAGTSFAIGLAGLPTAQWQLFVPKTNTENPAGQLVLWKLPQLEGDEPALAVPFDQLQIVMSPDPAAAGFALFAQIGETNASFLFAWNATNEFFEPLGELAQSFAQILPPPPPPPINFELLTQILGWTDPTIAPALAKLYELANSNNPDVQREFLVIFLGLPVEVQYWLANIIALTMQIPESPFSSVAQFIATQIAPSYLEYIENSGNKPFWGFFGTPAATLDTSKSPELLVAEAAAKSSTDGEERSWNPAIAVLEKDGSGFADGEAVSGSSIFLPLASPSLLRCDESNDRQGETDNPTKAGSRIGAQEMSGTRAARAKSAAESAQRARDFFARFGSKELPAGFLFSLASQTPEHPRQTEDFDRLVATELRRRIGSHARRA